MTGGGPDRRRTAVIRWHDDDDEKAVTATRRIDSPNSMIAKTRALRIRTRAIITLLGVFCSNEIKYKKKSVQEEWLRELPSIIMRMSRSFAYEGQMVASDVRGVQRTDGRSDREEHQASQPHTQSPTITTTMVLPRGGDVTEDVAKKLKLDPPLPRKVIQSTQDALNLLRFRNALGSFGRYDNERKRACAVLQYEAREQCGVQIPMDKLAKLSYSSKTEFEQFHQMIGNFRDNMKTTKQAGTRSTSNASDKSSSALQKSSIDRLSVQLGTFVPNSSVVASRAQTLLRAIHSHLNDHTSQKSHHQQQQQRRLHALQDVQRNRQAYEAACFYLVATNDSNPLKRRTVMRPSTDDATDRPLDLNTFLNATTHSFSKATFETVLAYVKELQEEIVEAQRGENGTTAVVAAAARYVPSAATTRMHGAVKRKREDNRKSMSAVSDRDKKLKSSKTGIMQSATDMVLKIAEQHDMEQTNEQRKNKGSRRDADNNQRQLDVPVERYPLPPKFVELKRKIVQAACLKAKESWNEKHAENESNVETTDKMSEEPNWLNLAVQQVLQQHGPL
jgi:hypothetical protein